MNMNDRLPLFETRLRRQYSLGWMHGALYGLANGFTLGVVAGWFIHLSNK